MVVQGMVVVDQYKALVWSPGCCYQHQLQPVVHWDYQYLCFWWHYLFDDVDHLLALELPVLQSHCCWVKCPLQCFVLVGYCAVTLPVLLLLD